MSKSSSSHSEALACPSCGRSYASDERFCEDCRMPLVGAGSAEAPASEAHERARKIRPELARGELVRVAGGRNQAEAELIQNILIEEGVPSVLRRSAGFDVPDFLAAGPRDILVAESGAEVAREVLGVPAPAQAPARPASPLWVQAFAVAMVLLVIAAAVAGLALAVLG